MWIAIKPFSYRGKRFAAGEEVPASGWPMRRALEIRNKIRFVKDSVESTAVASVDFKKMSRAELNVYATQIGIANPESYPNRDALLQALTGDAPMDEDSRGKVHHIDNSTNTPPANNDSTPHDVEETSESDSADDEDSEDSDAEEVESDEDTE